MKKTTRITLICIIAILLLAIIGGTIFAYVHKYAYAEYDDLTNKDIVNFNQVSNWYQANNEFYNFTAYKDEIYKITLVNQSITWARINIQKTSSQLYASHYYYVKPYFNNASEIYLYSGTNGTEIARLSNLQGIVVNGFNNYQFSFASYFASNPSATIYCAIMLVDLTNMFGQDNIPNVAQCNDLFIADYYPYNTGTPMFFGRSQMDNSYILDYVATTGNLTPSVSNASTTSVSYINDTYGSAISLFSNNSNPEQYEDYFLFNLDTTFTAGSIITITASNYLVKGSLSMVANNTMQQVLFSFENSNNSNTRRNVQYTFVVDEDFSSFWLVGSPLTPSTSTPFAIFPELKISVQYVDDIPSLIQGAKSLGIAEGESHFAYGTDGYNQIFNAGKQYALQHNSNNAWGSAWDFIESAFTGIGGLFAIEILPNVPLSVFILTPLMVILIFFIVKLVKGGS